MKSSLNSAKFLRGFTLVEMMVSIAVMITLSTVLVYGYPDTAVRLNLANVNADIAFLVRESQLRGSAVDSASGVFGGAGSFFDMATPTQAILFGDALDISRPMPFGLPIGNGLYDGVYDLGGGVTVNEARATTTLPEDFVISKLCVGAGVPFTCNELNVPPIQTLTISYIRPSPLPHIYINGATSTDYTGGCIEVKSPEAPAPGEQLPSGHIRSVQVFANGSIRTFKGGCSPN